MGNTNTPCLLYRNTRSANLFTLFKKWFYESVADPTKITCNIFFLFINVVLDSKHVTPMTVIWPELSYEYEHQPSPKTFILTLHKTSSYLNLTFIQNFGKWNAISVKERHFYWILFPNFTRQKYVSERRLT